VGRKLAYRDFTLEQVTVDGKLGGSAVAPLALQLEATGGANGAIRVDRLVAAASGTMGSHRVTLDLAAPAWHSHAEAAGALAARTWRGTLTSAEFDEDVLGRWHLVDPSAVAIGVRQVVFETLCLEHPSAGRWCGALDLRGQPGDRLVLVAQNFDLQTLRPLLPPAVSLEGVCQLSASLFDLTGNPRGALALTGENTRVRATTGDQQTYSVDLDELRAAATLANGRVELLAALRSGDAGKLEVNAAIRDVRLTNSAIEGTLSLAWPDVGFLTLLAPELGQVGGSVAGELSVGGTVDEPEVDGRAEWQGGRVAVAAWGLAIEGIEATASSRDGRAVEFDAKGHIGEGLVTTYDASQDRFAPLAKAMPKGSTR